MDFGPEGSLLEVTDRHENLAPESGVEFRPMAPISWVCVGALGFVTLLPRYPPGPKTSIHLQVTVMCCWNVHVEWCKNKYMVLRHIVQKQRVSILHWSRQTVVHRYAFPPEYNPDSTCRWPDRMAVQVALQVTDRTGSECTGKSVSRRTQHI